MSEGSGTCLQDNRAVGNSRLAHRDVLSVSCKQVPDPDRWARPMSRTMFALTGVGSHPWKKSEVW